MQKNVTIKDIAAEAGVSIALVSFVMNNRVESDGKQKYRVNENTKRRILEIAQKHNYQPNSAARALRKGRSLVIGLIVSDISNVFYGEIARQLENLAFQYGYTVLFGSSDENPEKFDRIVRSFIDKGVEGFVVVPCVGSEKSLWYANSVGVPLVIMDRKDINFPAPKIVLDNVQAMRKAVDILIEKGFRKIEMISYTMRVSSICGREEGFINRMRELGYKDEDIRIYHLLFEDIEQATDRIMHKIVASGVEGLVFANNALAVASIKKLSAMGVRVQQDIHLVGFDNSDVYSLFKPVIPHIGQPIEEITSLAFNYLKKLIEGEIEQQAEIIPLNGIVIQ